MISPDESEIEQKYGATAEESPSDVKIGVGYVRRF